jgi:hypothetical protein
MGLNVDLNYLVYKQNEGHYSPHYQ